MKKSTFLLPLFFLIVFSSYSQKYLRISVAGDAKTAHSIRQQGVEVVNYDYKNQRLILELPENELTLLEQNGIHYEVLIPDLVTYYRKRNLQTITPGTVKTTSSLVSQWPVPQNFSLGSCGGFSTVDEMLAQLDLMHAIYPNLITAKVPVSDTITTIEGRQVYYVKISDNPAIQEQEPQVLYTGMIHAREPVGMQHLLYFMWYLLENYASDPSIKALVDNLELYFVPIVNVDGYQYNIDTNPLGGGMWRKNRRNSGNNNYGVDLNRNFGYMWGYNNTGSSPTPSSETYRGSAPFSEPETRMIKYFCENHSFKMALNYHSYANKLLYAWGYSADPTPDDALFAAFAQEMTAENNYIYGPGYTTIYATNGSSDDWMYGEQTDKDKILAYTPEVGGQDDGFWPYEERIIPLCADNMLNSIMAARLSGVYARTVDDSPLFVQGDQGYVNFSLQRLGLLNGTFQVSVVPLSPAIISVDPPKAYNGLSILQKVRDSIGFKLSNAVHPGDTLRLLVITNNGSYETIDTLLRIYGQPVVLFADKFDNNLNWNGMYWGTTTSSWYSPSRSMTDSPYGNYYSGANYSISLTNRVPLPQALLTVLEYRAKWNIEPDFDYVQVKISRDNGNSWVPLQGRYTRPGSEYQLPDSPLYDGTRSSWMHEIINLNDYMGDSIQLRFTITSDYGVEYDGFYLDDIAISQIFDYTGIQTDKRFTRMENPVYEPQRSAIRVSYHLQPTDFPATITLFSSEGRKIQQITLLNSEGAVSFNAIKLPAGVYILALEGKQLLPVTRKCIVVK